MKILKELSRKAFRAKFGSEDQCFAYLSAIKWGKEYSCIKCKNDRFITGKKKHNRRCSRCGYDESPTAHTLFIKLNLVWKTALKWLMILQRAKKAQIVFG